MRGEHQSSSLSSNLTLRKFFRENENGSLLSGGTPIEAIDALRHSKADWITQYGSCLPFPCKGPICIVVSHEHLNCSFAVKAGLLLLVIALASSPVRRNVSHSAA